MARARFLRALGLLSAACSLAAPGAARAGLPPPPRSDAARPASAQLNLELLVNSAPTGRLVDVEAFGDGRLLIDAQDLRDAAVDVPAAHSGRLDVRSLAGVEATYDQERQRLLLQVPGEWLPEQRLGGKRGPDRVVPESSFGAVVNYDLYAARSSRGGTQASLWSEARVFGPFGVVRTTGVYNRSLSEREGSRFTRFDTQWTYVDDDRALTYEMGDLVTRTSRSATPVRLGGFQLSRDFSVRPDIVTIPLPTFSGTAAVPSAVDLFVNGQHASSGRVAPGPFTLSDVPYMTGSGTAVVLTTDAQGRQVSTSVPFYVASTLLKPGLHDFAVSVGRMRDGDGHKNLSYGSLAASGAWRTGLTPWLTVEAQAQAAKGLKLAGGGAMLRVGNLGVVSGSATFSETGEQAGSQIEIAYQYGSQWINFAVRHTRRNDDFADLASYRFPGAIAARRETQVHGSIALPGGLGTVGGGYIDTSRASEDYRLLSLSYFKPVWERGSLLLSVNHDLERNRTSAIVQLSISLGRAGNAVAGLEHDPSGDQVARLAYHRALPSDGGFAWRGQVGRSRQDGLQYQGELAWRSNFMQVQAGAYGSAYGDTQWADVSGSLVLMGGQISAANRIGDAFALVSTGGVAGVPVFHENQRVGVTNRRGYLLVPWMKAYQPAKFAIDPLELPSDTAASVVEQFAAVTLGGGRFVYFPVRKVAGAKIVLNDVAGVPIKAGTPLASDNGFATHVGWDGEAYVEDLQAMNRVTARLEDGSTCSAHFVFDTAAPHDSIGPLVCQ